MNLIMLTITAMRALRYHKTRTALTMLGIIIGISSIVATMAIGRGAQKKIEDQIAAIGDNIIVLYQGSPLRAKNTHKSSKAPQAMKINDLEALRKQLPLIKRITPMIESHKTRISTGTKNVECKLKGTTQDYLSIAARKILYGRNLVHEDCTLAKRVIILGHEAAEHLFFKPFNAIGQHVTINQKKYLVIGVIDKIVNHDPFSDPNLDAIMPYLTVQRRIHKSDERFPGYIFMSCINGQQLPTLVRQVNNIMRTRHNLKPRDPDDFTAMDQLSFGNARAQSSAIINILLLIVGSIALCVGGIGVMNIMLVSVTERTREIGIRMALGATRRQILVQFLVEAIVICLLGGLLGIILGIGIPKFAESLLKWPTVISSYSLLIATSVTVLVGLVAGSYPAYLASRLRPVQALQES